MPSSRRRPSWSASIIITAKTFSCSKTPAHRTIRRAGIFSILAFPSEQGGTVSMTEGALPLLLHVMLTMPLWRARVIEAPIPMNRCKTDEENQHEREP